MPLDFLINFFEKNPCLAQKLAHKELMYDQDHAFIKIDFPEFAESFFLENSLALLYQHSFFLEKVKKKGSVFIAEKNLARLKYVLSNKEIEDLIFHPSVDIIEKEQLTEQRAIEWGWKSLFQKRAFSPEFEKKESLEHMFLSVELTFSEYRDFGVKVYENIKKNLQQSQRAQVGDDLDLSSSTVVICGAGPSLKDSLRFLKEVKESAIIIAAGSSGSYLFRSGIICDACAVIDPSATLDRFLFLKNTLSTHLFYTLRANPEVVALASNKGVIFRGSGESLVEDKVWEEKEEKDPNIERGWNVVNFVASICAKAKAKEVIFVGVDCEYKEEREYPEGIEKQIDEKNTIVIEGRVTRKDLWVGKSFLSQLIENHTTTQWSIFALSPLKLQNARYIEDSFIVKKQPLEEVLNRSCFFGESLFFEKMEKEKRECKKRVESVLHAIEKKRDKKVEEHHVALELSEMEENLFYKHVLERVWQAWTPLMKREIFFQCKEPIFVQKILFLQNVLRTFLDEDHGS